MKKSAKSTAISGNVVPQNNQIVIAIGASAGGLEALQDFFKAMPTNTNLAFVVIQHLSPDYKSLMNELLARYTKIPIQPVTDGLTVEPNNIYLIPPRKTFLYFTTNFFLKIITPKKD
jgi:two-component system, chemotaxis family, CheB/CheR fusion protein